MAFIYPPFAALVLEPLSLEPWPAALFLWRITLTAMVFLSVYLCLLLIECNNRFTHFVVVTAAVVWFFPFTETIFQGQIDPVILLCWAGGAYLIKRDRPVWSALLFAMGTLVKASPIIVVGLFLMRRQWKWLISYTLWCGLLLGISIWRLGWENHVIWASKVLPALSQGVPYFANKSVSALIYELYLRRVPVDFDFSIPHFLPRIIGVFNFLIYCAALLFLWTKNRKANAMTYELIVMALLAVVISPVSWRHHYLLALLPVTYLWYELKDDWRDWSLLATVTLAMGTVFIDYAIVVIRKPIVDLPLASVLPISTLLLLILALANYAPITVRERNEQRPTNLLRAA